MQHQRKSVTLLVVEEVSAVEIAAVIAAAIVFTNKNTNIEMLMSQGNNTNRKESS